MGLMVAQLSDLHVSMDPEVRLAGRRAVDTLDATLAALPCGLDAIVLTGDITDTADEASTAYVHARISELGLPTRWLAGNHDDPLVLDRVAPEWLGPLTIGAWTIVSVQTFVGGEWFGRITSEEYSRIDEIVARAAGYVAMAMHQPPIGICSAAGCVLEDPGSFFSFTDSHPSIRAVITGHQHRAFQHSRNGVLLAGAGSSCAQMDHLGDDFAMRSDPPAAQLLELGDDGRCRVRPLAAADAA